MCMCVCVTSRYACLCESVLETTVMLHMESDDHPGVTFVAFIFDYRKISDY